MDSALPHCWYSALTRVIDLRIHPLQVALGFWKAMLLIIALSRSHYRFSLPSKLVFIFSASFNFCHLATCSSPDSYKSQFLRGAGFTRSQAVVTFALICVIDLLQLLPVHEVAACRTRPASSNLDEGSLGSLVITDIVIRHRLNSNHGKKVRLPVET